MLQPNIPTFRPLTGIYEPSGILQLPDGRFFLVVEDEQRHAFSFVTLSSDGHVNSTAIKASFLQMFSDFWKLDDLEGITLDRSGWVHAITSHSRTESGGEKDSRERLVRFRIDGNRVVESQVFEGLKKALTARYSVLAAAAQIREVKTAGGLNIEALEFSADGQRLLIGFRSPLHGGRALIASVENAAGIFDADETPRFDGELIELDLAGQGIRSLSYLPSLGDFLLVAGPAARGATPFALWRWSGLRGDAARHVTVAGLDGFAHAEGVCPATIDGQPRIVVVSDDGNRQAGRCASFVLLRPDQLQTTL